MKSLVALPKPFATGAFAKALCDRGFHESPLLEGLHQSLLLEGLLQKPWGLHKSPLLEGFCKSSLLEGHSLEVLSVETGFAKALVSPLVKLFACHIHTHILVSFPTYKGASLEGLSQKPFTRGAFTKAFY